MRRGGIWRIPQLRCRQSRPPQHSPHKAIRKVFSSFPYHVVVPVSPTPFDLIYAEFNMQALSNESLIRPGALPIHWESRPSMRTYTEFHLPLEDASVTVASNTGMLPGCHHFSLYQPIQKSNIYVCERFFSPFFFSSESYRKLYFWPTISFI